ncbi:MAG: hypothetical protein HYT80_04940 [Euryarchaeota archaeon]|nr:hypothetical protein [Euryarchaeota archaeon]
MASRVLSISLSQELLDALNRLKDRRGEERSRLVETLLRENPYVLDEIRQVREAPRFKKGRSPSELDRLVRFGRRRLERQLRSGRVTWPDA